MMTRRELLLAGSTAAVARSAQGDPWAGDRLFQYVKDYAAFGEHRSAGPADLKTSEWLESALHKAGFRSERRPFALQQFFLRKISLTVQGKLVKAFPLWWPKTTGPSGVNAPLAATGLSPEPGSLRGKIAVIELPEAKGAILVKDDDIHRIVAAMARAQAAAVVGVSSSATGEILMLNAQAGLEPWPLPFVMAGKKVQPALRDGLGASLVVEGDYNRQARAYEVLGRLERGKRLFVVSTPYSGWFECAGERGPGVALWIALAQWIAGRKSDVSYLFVASSGHELDGVGMKSFLDEVVPKPSDVAAWLHLGAGIATYDYRPRDGGGIEMLKTVSPARRLYTVPQFAPLLQKAFAPLPDVKPIVSEEPAGELLLISRRRYRVFGFASGSAFHHMPGDLPPLITGPELLEPVGRALAEVFTELEKG